MNVRIGSVIAILALVVVTSSGVLPVQLSYVTSDSMEPTLSPGDGYVLVESDADVGDVITFSTSDGYVTHRVVGESDEGYVTRGDANPSTDQSAGLPPVEETQVVGRALTVGGHVVVVPGLGPVAKFVDTYRPVLLAGVLMTALTLALREKRATVPNRELVHVRDVVMPLLAGLTVGCVVLLVASVTTEHLTFIATATGSGATLTVGEPAVQTVTVDVVRAPLTQTVIDAHGVQVVEKTTTASTATLDVRVPAQATAGPYTATVTVHPYPAVVPRGLLLWLHRLDPAVACIASTAIVFAPVWLVYLSLFDGRSPLRFVSRDGPDPETEVLQ